MISKLTDDSVPKQYQYLINDPEARYAIRDKFYKRFGANTNIFSWLWRFLLHLLTGGHGQGRSELDFLRWEIDRGVLNTLDEANQKGSIWWRNVNLDFIITAEDAGELYLKNKTAVSSDNETNLWLNYIKERTGKSWYRAHNATIIRGYLNRIKEAKEETFFEQRFMNEVLYRLLFAQAMEEDGSVFKELGAIAANPMFGSVELITQIPAFYPMNYPLTKEDVRNVLHKGYGLAGDLERLLDEQIIVPHLDVLMKEAAVWLNIHELNDFVKNGKAVYPFISAEPKISTKEKGQKKKKIAILGSGVGSLTTAFELTDYPGWDELYDITIYQMGWRAGGKTASARGKNNRVEERGIHILQGWYWNMFRFIRRVYDTRRDQGVAPGIKFQDWKDAVVKDDTTLLTTEKQDGTWDSWPFIFPEDRLIPGDAGGIGTKVMLTRILGIVLQLFFGSPYKTRTGILRFIPNFLFGLLMKDYPVNEMHPRNVPNPNYGADPRKNAAKCVDDISANLEDRSTIKLNPALFITMCVFIWPISWAYLILRILLFPLLRVWTQLNRFFSALEWILISTKGALKDCYSFKQRELVFTAINDVDYRVWLKKHGGSAMMIKSGLVKFMYYGSFANLKGDQAGILASDIALRIVLDTLFYKGALVWKTRAGTGGTLIAPAYQVLKARGVKFNFFHRVEKIAYSATNEIQEIVMAEQIKLATGVEEYNPLITVNDLVDWPDGPLLDQIDPEWAAKIKSSGVNLESSWADWKDYKTNTLKLGEDFDQIVLGIPVAALKSICSEIVEKNETWKEMVNNVPTTQTFGVQLWIKPTIEEMGFHGPDWGLRTTDEPNSVNYANLLYSWTDMTQILAEEDWPADNMPGDLAYFTGTMADSVDPLPPPSDHSFPQKEHKRVFDFTKEWLAENMGWFFPKAAPADNLKGLDLSLLADPDNGSTPLSGDELYAKQYFCANIDDSNRYTLAYPGTDKYRLKANESGYSNLFLTGDWTDFGLNVGHMEGTCVSGIRGAVAVLNTYAKA